MHPIIHPDVLLELSFGSTAKSCYFCLCYWETTFIICRQTTFVNNGHFQCLNKRPICSSGAESLFKNDTLILDINPVCLTLSCFNILTDTLFFFFLENSCCIFPFFMTCMFFAVYPNSVHGRVISCASYNIWGGKWILWISHAWLTAYHFSSLGRSRNREDLFPRCITLIHSQHTFI